MIVLTRRFPNGRENSCTARCYNSTHRKCTCICKGLLHGKGEPYAKLLAPKAAFYLQLQSHDGSTFFAASELIADMQGR